MGHLAAQVNKGAFKSIKVEAEGEVSDFIDSLVTFGVVGVLKESLGESVNYVNAEFVAKERGIEILKDSKPSSSGYKNRVTLTLTTDKDLIKIGGTIFEENVQCSTDCRY